MQQSGADLRLALFLCMKPCRSLIKPSWSSILSSVDTQQRESLDKHWGSTARRCLLSTVVEPVDPARVEPGSDCPPQSLRHLNCCHLCRSGSRLKITTVITERFSTVDKNQSVMMWTVVKQFICVSVSHPVLQQSVSDSFCSHGSWLHSFKQKEIVKSGNGPNSHRV